MQFRRVYYFPIFILSTMLFTACPEESEYLVNPPSNATSVLVRFVNLAGKDQVDQKPRTFVMNEKYETAPVGYSSSSSAVNPPSDSVKATVRLNGVDEFADTLVYRFSRNLTYSFVGLPSIDGDSLQGPITSFAVLTSSSVIKKDSKQAYVKVLNAVPDKNRSYSIRFGCPNGKAIVQNLAYRRFSPVVPIQSGVIAISLIVRKSNSVDSIIGLFGFDLDQRGQYTFVVRSGGGGGEEIWILDELDKTSGAFQKAVAIDAESQITEIRAINFSQSEVKLMKEPGEDIGEPLPPGRIGGFIGIGACASEDADVITAYTGPGFAYSSSSVISSLVVLEKYTVLVFDSAETAANKMVLIKPDRESHENTAKIRVVHQAESFAGLTVSIGARNDNNPDNELRFSSGEKLADTLTYGNVSNVSFIEPGYAPITIFTSTNPAKYVTSAPAYLETGKSYLLVITNFGFNTRVTLIEEDAANGDIEYLEEGVFVEAVHALPGPVAANTVSVGIDDILSDAVLFYSSSLLTVVSQGSHTINIAGQSLTFDAELGQRNLFIISGEIDYPEILQFSSYPMDPSEINYKRRFINASSENPMIHITDNPMLIRVDTVTNDTTRVTIAVPYGSVSEVREITKENKISLYFYKTDNFKDDFITRINDLSFIYGKSYSIIFAGSRKYGGYSIIVQQEF